MAKRKRNAQPRPRGSGSKPLNEEFSDPFEVIGPIPKGQSYQWVATSVHGSEDAVQHILDKMKRDGWKPVPARRHPTMPRNKAGQIAFGGQLLVKRRVKQTTAARKEEVDRALAMFAEHPVNSQAAILTAPDASLPSDHFERLNAAREYLKETGGAVNVTIGIALTDSEVETAVLLRLTPDEYARRKVLMLSDLPSPGSAVVLKEVRRGVFNFSELKIHRYPEDSA